MKVRKWMKVSAGRGAQVFVRLSAKLRYEKFLFLIKVCARPEAGPRVIWGT